MIPITLKSKIFDRLTESEFFDFCQTNRDLRIEKTLTGEIAIKAPTYANTGRINFRIALELGKWNDRDNTGICFDSSTGFTLPNGAVRSPDVSWISKKRWNALPDNKKDKFAHICPEFIIELISESDRLNDLQEKMDDYMSNGCQLGWLINPSTEEVYVYQLGQSVDLIKGFDQELVGSPVLSGFVLDLRKLREL